MTKPAVSGSLTPLTFDSTALPVPQQFAAWQAALSRFSLSRTGDGPFTARAMVWKLGSLILTHAFVDPLRYDRPAARIELDLVDHYALVFLIEGRFTGDYGWGERLSAATTLTVLDMQQPCWTEADHLQAYVLSFPRASLAERVDGADLHGAIVGGGLARLLGALLGSILGALPTLEREQAPALEAMVADLVAATLIDARGREERRDERQAAIVSRVRAYIDQNLAEPLGVQAICAALNLSRSGLYRAFGDSGGVLRQVQRRRLHRLRTLLADPGETRSIAALAAAHGLPDKSHFARLFKRAYGTTPGEFRARALAGRGELEDVTDIEAPTVFRSWAESLD